MKFRAVTFFALSDLPVGIIMILIANTHNKSREWSGSTMISNWRTIDGYRHVRSTWWIRVDQWSNMWAMSRSWSWYNSRTESWSWNNENE